MVDNVQCKIKDKKIYFQVLFHVCDERMLRGFCFWIWTGIFVGFIFSVLLLCPTEHPEDKQFPVHPAACHSCCVCYHPQLAPTGLGLLRHAHRLQSCWWVCTFCPHPYTESSPLSWDCLLFTFLVPAIFLLAHSYEGEMWVNSQFVSVWLLLF